MELFNYVTPIRDLSKEPLKRENTLRVSFSVY